MAARIAFQGELGAYSHAACRTARPDMDVLPCPTFEDAIEACLSGQTDLAMLPVENSTYGRVADIHALLPNSSLKIIDEAFVRVEVALMGPTGATLSGVRHAMSHAVLLGQVRGFLREHGIRTLTGADTAGSARIVAERADPELAALAPRLAAEIYGLQILADGVEDNADNTTRFLLCAREADLSRRAERMVTTFTFRVRNIPAALYKALGGFATNGVNMTKLESYMVGGAFVATEFYADIEGHPDDANVKLALDELAYFTTNISILGTYPRRRP
ncbi:prephenate dehydratase [Falsirhodobacter algicola]|uniref:prephenate dehydratase n=1 Tax=Falsirhodobacter algicola TaxID=2692330 RepID=A0A8J8MSC6_9RHOB|nr:prephenate dehydratase [Falsirhodobacter algicola]QUS35882.1 prephenate dehydratase [Falsirhodobacter algicola]